jgi:hypothetical protein
MCKLFNTSTKEGDHSGITTFIIIAVFCLIGNFLAGQRCGGKSLATLHDSEVFTIEFMEEGFWIYKDSGIFAHFYRYYSDWLPSPRKIHRTDFVRQAATSWNVKQDLLQEIVQDKPNPYLSMMDSFQANLSFRQNIPLSFFA